MFFYMDNFTKKLSRKVNAYNRYYNLSVLLHVHPWLWQTAAAPSQGGSIDYIDFVFNVWTCPEVFTRTNQKITCTQHAGVAHESQLDYADNLESLLHCIKGVFIAFEIDNFIPLESQSLSH